MADIRENILNEVAKQEGYNDAVDMICINGAIDKVYLAMDENGKRLCLELLEYMAKHNVMCGISDDGSSEFYYKGQIISKNELFENFL